MSGLIGLSATAGRSSAMEYLYNPAGGSETTESLPGSGLSLAGMQAGNKQIGS